MIAEDVTTQTDGGYGNSITPSKQNFLCKVHTKMLNALPAIDWKRASL